MSFDELRKHLDKYMKYNYPFKDYNRNGNLTLPFRFTKTKILASTQNSFDHTSNSQTFSIKDDLYKTRCSNSNNPRRKVNKRVFKCCIPECDKMYTSSYGLKYHLKEGHTEEKLMVYKPFICKVQGCNRKYKNNNGLKYHLQKYHNH